MRRKSGAWGKWGMIQLSIMLTIGPGALGTPDNDAKNDEISTQKEKSESRKYDAKLEIYKARLPIMDAENNKTKRLNIPKIPEVTKKEFFTPGLRSEPTIYRPPRVIERAPVKKKNWILPPKPDFSEPFDERTGTDSVQDFMGTLRKTVDAQMSTKNRLKAIVDRLQPGGPRPNESPGYLHERTEDRLRQASENLVDMEDEDVIVFEQKSGSNNNSANVAYAPVVLDQVFANRPHLKHGDDLIAVLSDQNLENISKDDLAQLKQQEAHILSYAREAHGRIAPQRAIQLRLPGVVQFTRANGFNSHLGLRQTQSILSKLNGQETDNGSEREETQYRASSALPYNSWKSTFSTLASALRPSGSHSTIQSSSSEYIRLFGTGVRGDPTMKFGEGNGDNGEFKFGGQESTSDSTGF